MKNLKYQVRNYPDGTSYVHVEEFSDQLFFRLNSYNDLWVLRQIKDVCDFNKQEVNLTLPNLLEGQADRRFNSNESSGLKLVCEFINNMKFKTIKCFHPHNSEVVEALIDNVEIIDNSEYIKEILMPYKGDNLVVLLPDGGAYKWGVKLMDKVGFTGEVLACAKNRVYDGGKSKLTQQLPDFDFTGRNLIIIDDINIGGGTFKGLSKMLKERNCGKMYLAVSHMTVENLGLDPVTNYFDKVFATNSKGLEYYAEGTGHDKAFGVKPENLEVINLFK